MKSLVVLLLGIASISKHTCAQNAPTLPPAVKALQQSFNAVDEGSSDPTTVSSKGPNLNICSNLVYLACAAYCSKESVKAWSCPCCKQAKSLGYQLAGMARSEKANTFCFLTINKAKKEIVFTCRGTWNVQNLMQDLEVALKKPVPCDGKTAAASSKKQNSGASKPGKVRRGRAAPADIKVHTGFYKAICSVYPLMVQKLRPLLKKNKGYKLIFTGHSLGAAMSNIAGYLTITGGIKAQSYAFCGFGEPRVGNKAYADWWNARKAVVVTRITNKADPVPHIPTPAMGYLHHGTEVWFNGMKNVTCTKNKYEDPDCSNTKGPAYDIADHSFTWGVEIPQCAATDPAGWAAQVLGSGLGNTAAG